MADSIQWFEDADFSSKLGSSKGNAFQSNLKKSATVYLKKFTKGCSQQSEYVVHFHDLPKADFEINRTGDEFQFALKDSQDLISTYWSLGDGTTGSGYSLKHTYNLNGQYEVVASVKSLEGCKSVQKDTIDIVLSTLELADRSNFFIFPNPFHNQVTIKADQNLGEGLTLEIFDIQGNTLYFKEGLAFDNYREITISSDQIEHYSGAMLFVLSSDDFIKTQVVQRIKAD